MVLAKLELKESLRAVILVVRAIILVSLGSTLLYSLEATMLLSFEQDADTSPSNVMFWLIPVYKSITSLDQLNFKFGPERSALSVY